MKAKYLETARQHGLCCLNIVVFAAADFSESNRRISAGAKPALRGRDFAHSLFLP